MGKLIQVGPSETWAVSCAVIADCPDNLTKLDTGKGQMVLIIPLVSSCFKISSKAQTVLQAALGFFTELF